jgi:hypothetical protein
MINACKTTTKKMNQYTSCADGRVFLPNKNTLCWMGSGKNAKQAADALNSLSSGKQGVVRAGTPTLLAVKITINGCVRVMYAKSVNDAVLLRQELARLNEAMLGDE